MRWTRVRPQRGGGCVGLLAALLLGLPGLVWAAVAEAPSVQDLAASSDVAIHGSVLSVQSAWNETRSLIVSYVTLQVTEVLRGSPPPGPAVLRVPGGVLPEEDLGMRVSGAAEFRPGEEVVVLLRRPVEAGFVREAAGPAFYRVAGGALGKFAVEVDPHSGGKQAVRKLGAVVGEGRDATERIPLEAFKRLVRAAAREGGR